MICYAMARRPKVSMVVLQYYKSEIRSLDVDGFGFVVALIFKIRAMLKYRYCNTNIQVGKKIILHKERY